MLTIMNAALIAQGQYEIVTDGDGSDEWRLLSQNWPQIVEAELEDGKYHYARRQAFLASRVDGKFGYPDGYLVPGDALHVRRVWVLDERGERELIDWGQDGSAIYVTEADGIYAEIMVSADPSLWSANFRQGVQKRLEALIARSIREEYTEAEALDRMAEVHFQRARTNSSQSRSARPMYQRGPIASARFGRGTH